MKMTWQLCMLFDVNSALTGRRLFRLTGTFDGLFQSYTVSARQTGVERRFCVN